jgi:hypothetical protein
MFYAKQSVQQPVFLKIPSERSIPGARHLANELNPVEKDHSHDDSNIECRAGTVRHPIASQTARVKTRRSRIALNIHLTDLGHDQRRCQSCFAGSD